MRVVRLVVAAALLGWVSTAAAAMPGQLCEKKTVAALRSCGKSLAGAQTSCLKRTGAACLAGDAKIAAALAKLADKVLDACPDGTTIAAAGYPALLTPAGLVDRLHEACESATVSLMARSFGGPHTAARTAADATGRACLDYAFGQGRKLIDYALKQQSACVLAAHAGKTCDPAAPAAKVAARETKTVDAIARKCADLSSLVAVDPATFVDRALDQAECLTATSHGGTAPLALACGPRASVPVAPLATATTVTLPFATWGTRCGNGSDYSFSYRLAPAGFPVGNVVVHMQGGGSCADGPSCAAQPPGLFTAEEGLGQTGVMSNTNAASPYLNWTKVFIPYCTQDGHLGDGMVNVFPEMTVHRYGARNLRAALRYMRDVLWASMDASDPEGFRPDRLRVLFTGSSAGGQGAQFNYHYVLDDLRWTHTTLVADSAIGLDNGSGLRQAAAAFALSLEQPGWGGRPMAPPYCFSNECGVAWNTLMFAQSPRLLATPEQRILSVTNQVDATQRNGYGYPNNGAFVNDLRARWCEQRGTPGLHAFLSAASSSEHGNINENAIYNGTAAQGQLLRDWLGEAMTSPETLTDRVGQGTIVPDIAGAQPFPCDAGSPSGAFVE